MANLKFLSPIQNLQIDSANRHQLSFLMLLATYAVYHESIKNCSAEQIIIIDFSELKTHQNIAVIRELCDLMEEHLLSS